MTRNYLPAMRNVILGTLVGVTLFSTDGLSHVAVAAGLVYVDADDGFVTANPNLSPLSAIDSNVSIRDNLWGYRPFGNDASIFESSINADPGDENSPELTLTLNTSHGLVTGTSYDIYVAYWSANGANWSIKGRLPTGPQTIFNRTGPLAFLPDAVAGTPASSAFFSVAPMLTTQDDRVMLLGKVGAAVATGGQINVLIDDLPTTDFAPDITPANAVNFRSWLDGVAFIETGTPLSLQANINRDTGQLTLANNTGATVSFTSISITSASQALDATKWTSITANYDQGGLLDTDAWETTAPAAMPFPTAAPALTEIESAGAGSPGATFVSGGAPINLGNVWKDTRFSDVQLAVTLTSGTVLNLTPTYSGTAHVLGDFNNNGSLGLEDYQIFTANIHSDVSALGQADAYLRGDMNGDLVINYADFVAFRDAFPSSGAGSFAAVIGQAAVPEPTAVALLLMAILLGSTMRIAGNRRLVPARIARPAQAVATKTRSLAPQPRMNVMFRFSRLSGSIVFLAVLSAPILNASAANVTLNTSDTLGNTSFNAAGNWSNAAAPSAGNAYFTGNFGLRTPADGGSYTFGGDSLTVNNTNFDPMVPATPAGGLWYKGTGNTGVITINNLILDGGLITHINGPEDLFQLAGNINVVSNSYIQGRQGAINILANISGTGTITNPNSDGDGRIVRFMSPNNTYSGSIVNNGRFELSDNARMNFVIGASGVNNSISGIGAQNLLNGDFNINLTGASTMLGDSWTLVSATNRTFGETFNVPGFFEYATGLWVNGNYQFDESTGVLSVAPAPDLLTLRVNTSTGAVSVANATTATSFNMNYYEIRSASGSLDLGGWTSIDGNIPVSNTSWEKASASTANLISETNLQGMLALNPTASTSLGSAYAGTLPAHQDLQFYYGTADASGTLFRGFVEYVTGGLTGDYNGDGSVNAADYTVWRDTLNQSVPSGTGADGNNNGMIDTGDYAVWKSNFGLTGGTGSASASATNVPEPNTALVAIVALTMAMTACRRSAYFTM